MALAVVVCLLLLVLASLADAATRVDPIPHDNAFAPLAGGSSVPYGRVDRKGGVEMTGSLLFNTTLPFVFVDSLPGFRRFVRGKKAGTWVLTGHSASIDRAAEAWKGHVGNLLVSAEPRWGMIAEEGEVTHDPDHAAKLVTRIEKRNGTALVLHIADAPRRSVIGVEARALVPFSLLSRDMTFSGTYKTDLPNLWYSRGPMSIGCNNCNLTLKGSVYIWGGLSLKGIGVCSTVTVSADLQLNPYFTLSASAAAEYEFFRKPVPNLSISFWKFTIGVQAIAKAVAGTGASFTAQASFFMSTGDLKFSKTLAGATTQCGSSHIGNGFTFRQTADPSLAVSTQPFSVTLGIATVLLVGVQYSKTTYGVYAGPEVGIQYAAEKLSDCPKATKKSLSLVSQLDVGLEYNQKGTWDTSFSLFTLPLWKKSDPTTGYTQCGSSCIDNNQFATDNKNCGVCGKACSGGLPCVNSVCAKPTTTITKTRTKTTSTTSKSRTITSSTSAAAQSSVQPVSITPGPTSSTPAIPTSTTAAALTFKVVNGAECSSQGLNNADCSDIQTNLKSICGLMDSWQIANSPAGSGCRVLGPGYGCQYDGAGPGTNVGDRICY